LVSTQFAGSLDHAVGALGGFDGDDIACTDGHGLADAEFDHAVEEGPTEVDVALGGGVGGGFAHGPEG